MALMTLLLARLVGRLTDSIHPRIITAFGFVCLFAGLLWLTFVMTPDTSIWWTVPPMVVFGIGNAFVWAPNSATATRNLPLQQAGAGSGVYNATRQVGAVLGSAAIAVLIDSRLAAEGLPSFTGGGASAGGGNLPPEVAQAFSDAMATSVLLPVAAFVLGFIAVLFFERPRHQGWAPGRPRRPRRPRRVRDPLSLPDERHTVRSLLRPDRMTLSTRCGVSRRPTCPPSAGSRRPRRPGRPCRPRPPCPRRGGRRPSCCRPRRRS